MAKIIAQLRVKNGILFLNEWLQRMETLVDEIVAVDNGSTDGTFEILKNHPKVTRLEQTQGFDEGRDRIRILDLAREQNADWHIWLDVDEIFENRLTRSILDNLTQSKKFTKYYFRRFNFHKDYEHFEAGISKLLEQSCWSRVMWKEQASGYLPNIKIHVGNIQGIKGKGKFLDYRIKHIGSVNRDYLTRKTEIYKSVEPERKTTYDKHRDQELPVWRWYEFQQNPVLVRWQLFLLSMLFLMGNPAKRVRRFILNKKHNYGT